MKDFVSGNCAGKKSTSDACTAEAADRVAALVAYVKTLDPPTTAFDEGRLTKDELAGEKLFQGKGGCIECHGGPLFTDNLIHNTGVPQVTFKSPYRDPGAPDVTSNDKGAPPPPPDPGCTGTPPPAGCDAAPTAGSAFINTPQLRDLKNTAPYMHNGAFATLEQVVRFYSGKPLSDTGMPENTVPLNPRSNVGPLNLTEQEMSELVAYLETL